MGLFRTMFRIGFKPAVDVKSWMGYEYLKNNTRSLFFWIKDLLFLKKIKRRRRKETFEQAITRMHITEDELANKTKALIRNVYLYLSMAFFCFIYAFYLIFKINISAGLLTIMLASYLVVKAYIAHFWYFEIKNRKLGCGFKDWLHGDVEQEQQEKG